jgi:hypothetical protein
MSTAIARVGATIQGLTSEREIIRGRSLTSLSHRSVLLKETETGEALEILSPDGEVEIRLTFGETGPIVHVRGTRLELETPDTLALHCRKLEVTTEEGIRL